MAYIRDETLDNFTDEELLEIVKRNLDKLGIPYEEGPGDWSGFLGLDPADFDTEEYEESYTIQTRTQDRDQYRAKVPEGCMKVRMGSTLLASGQS